MYEFKSNNKISNKMPDMTGCISGIFFWAVVFCLIEYFVSHFLFFIKKVAEFRVRERLITCEIINLTSRPWIQIILLLERNCNTYKIDDDKKREFSVSFLFLYMLIC